MAYIQWSEMYSVNINYIDEQHKKLFEITNKFHLAIKLSNSRDQILSIFNQLIQYTQSHFADEENIMKQIGVPEKELKSHIALHNTLMERVFGVYKQFENDEITSIYQMERFLDEWLISHVLHTDKKYQEYGRTQPDIIPIKF